MNRAYARYGVTAMIETIPDIIDLSQDYLVPFWAGELGVSRGRLEQAISLVSNDLKQLRKLLNDGHRIAIRDGAGVGRHDPDSAPPQFVPYPGPEAGRRYFGSCSVSTDGSWPRSSSAERWGRWRGRGWRR